MRLLAALIQGLFSTPKPLATTLEVSALQLPKPRYFAQLNICLFGRCWSSGVITTRAVDSQYPDASAVDEVHATQAKQEPHCAEFKSFVPTKPTSPILAPVCYPRVFDSLPRR